MFPWVAGGLALWAGVLWALANGFFESFVDVTRKQGASHFDDWSSAWGMRFYATLFLLPLAYVMRPHSFPHHPSFWWATAGSVAINTYTSMLYMRAIRRSDISLVLPVTTLSPVFMVGTARFITGEALSPLGILGIVVSCAGIYTLSFRQLPKGLFAPFLDLWKASERRPWFYVRSLQAVPLGLMQPFLVLWKDPDLRSMLYVAILWSISAPIEKVAIVHGDPYWFAGLVNAGLVMSLTFFLFRYGKPRHTLSLVGFRWLAPVGLFVAASAFCQYKAIGLMFVPYAIGLKRTSVLWGVVWGKLKFKEGEFGLRLTAAILTVIGTGLIIVTQTKR